MSTCQVHVEQVVVHVTDATADVRVSVAERGPPGLTTVSADRGNLAQLGSDSKLFVSDEIEILALAAL